MIVYLSCTLLFYLHSWFLSRLFAIKHILSFLLRRIFDYFLTTFCCLLIGFPYFSQSNANSCAYFVHKWLVWLLHTPDALWLCFCGERGMGQWWYKCNPGLILCRCHTWVEFVVGSCLPSRVFHRVLRFSFLLSSQHFQIPILTTCCRADVASPLHLTGKRGNIALC